MPLFEVFLEDDTRFWTGAEVDCPDPGAACDCAVLIASVFFAKMHHDALDWSRCRIRVAAANGAELLLSSAADVALLERECMRIEGLLRTDH